MINTLKLIYRNLRKNLSINLINLGGLALSMAVVLMLSAYCYTQLMTDQHHNKPENTYLIAYGRPDSDFGINSPGVVADFLKSDIPEINRLVRTTNTWNQAVIQQDHSEPFVTELIFADDGFFDLFQYEVLRGDLSKALETPRSIVLTKSEAIRLFGTIDVVGKSILINNEHLVQITAVIQQPAHNTFLSFKVLAPIEAMHFIQPDDEEFTHWNVWNFQMFIRTNGSIDEDILTAKIADVFIKRSEGKSDPGNVSLLPISQIYFSGLDNSWLDYLKQGDKTKVLILLMVAILILGIAIINYLNISRYTQQERLTQIGIFKILGVSKIQLLRNSILESTLMFILSVWLAVLLAELARNSLGQLTVIMYNDESLLSLSFLGISFLVATLLGIITSIIPAIQQSLSHPISNLKKEIRSGSKHSRYQGAMVIFQFYAAIILIMFTLLVNKQIQFGSTDLGFNEENIIAVQLTPQLKKDIIKERLRRESGISQVSVTQFFPNKEYSHWLASMNADGKTQDVNFSTFNVDGAFFDLMELQLVTGKLFNDSTVYNKNKMIVNEAFIKKYGINNPFSVEVNDQWELIGVIKDFHYKSKNKPIEPLVLLDRGYSSMCLVKVQSGNFDHLLRIYNKIQDTCSELSPDFPVEVSFMDMAVNQMYQSEIQFRRIFTFFSVSAIFISCLGILALSLFASQRRTKEIGIRKVNGAYTGDILRLLNKDFTKWVLISFALAIPSSFFIMNKWLQQFAYKTNISWWIFLLGGLSALVIGLLTVSWQSWKAARRNPVDALRYE